MSWLSPVILLRIIFYYYQINKLNIFCYDYLLKMFDKSFYYYNLELSSQCEIAGYHKLIISCEPFKFQYFVQGSNNEYCKIGVPTTEYVSNNMNLFIILGPFLFLNHTSYCTNLLFSNTFGS